MSIKFDKTSKIFQLDTRTTSYLIGIADETYIGHLFYGKKLRDFHGAEAFLRTGEAPFVPSENAREKGSFADTFPYEYSTWGVGDYRESCLMVRTEDGCRVCELEYENYRIFDGKPGLPGLPATFEHKEKEKDGNEQLKGDAQTLEITCVDRCIHLKVILSYSVFADSDAVIRSVRLINEGDEKLYLERVLSTCMDMDDPGYEILTLNGSWARERHMTRYPLAHGSHHVGSVRGESSHQAQPFLALMTPGTTQEYGEVYAMHFLYSGNFLGMAELSQFESVRMGMGIHPDGFEWVLNPGETFQAPEVVCVYSDEGLGKMTRTFHDLYRNHLIRSPYLHKKRPILINNWEATYFDFTSDKLVEIAKEAKKAGIEMLVMDDGWFGHRSYDDSSLGDWYVNEEKIPEGLHGLVERVKAEGLQFGIWFEPEMISPDSELYRTHPDWALQVPGRTPVQSRAQYVLDLSRQEVVDYVYECVAKILRSADISYVKWDMNRQLTDMGSSALPPECQGELFHRYVLGVYQLQERLITEFPELLLENCSGGGARFDPGMLYYSPQIWCSDDTDAVERLAIQEGTALLYPLSAIGAHVSDSPNHTVGRTTPFATRGHVALAGTFGYELDITKLSEKERGMIREQTKLYHAYHPLIREGDYYRIASWQENHLYDCWEVAAKDRSEAIVTYVQVLAEANKKSRKIRLKGLDVNARYQLEETGQIYSGAVLMYGGIQIERRMGDYQSRILHFRRISEIQEQAGPFQRLESDRRKVGRFIVTEDRVRVNGQEQPYDYLEVRPGVSVLPIKNGRVIVQSQYRYPVRSWQWEIPGGFIDTGETPEEAAVRELKEETGYDVKNIRSLGAFHPSFGSTNEKIYLFVAECGEKGEDAKEPGEVIRTEELEAEAFEKLVVSGEFMHGAGLAAWARYRG